MLGGRGPPHPARVQTFQFGIADVCRNHGDAAQAAIRAGDGIKDRRIVTAVDVRLNQHTAFDAEHVEHLAINLIGGFRRIVGPTGS